MLLTVFFSFSAQHIRAVMEQLDRKAFVDSSITTLALPTASGSIKKMKVTYFHVKMITCNDQKKETFLSELKHRIKKDDIDLAFWDHVYSKMILADIGKGNSIKTTH
jgi:hypothetical protein